jgi:hypothetical protein
MFEGLKGKCVKCVYKDGNQDKAIVGLLKEATDKFLLIYSRGNDIYINVDSIVSLFEREADNYEKSR